MTLVDLKYLSYLFFFNEVWRIIVSFLHRFNFGNHFYIDLWSKQSEIYKKKKFYSYILLLIISLSFRF